MSTPLKISFISAVLSAETIILPFVAVPDKMYVPACDMVTVPPSAVAPSPLMVALPSEKVIPTELSSSYPTSMSSAAMLASMSDFAA